MRSADATHYSTEETKDYMLDLVHLADLEHLLQLGQEERLLHAVREWPVFEQPLKQRDCESAVLREEEHRGAQQLFVERGAGLHLVKRDDNILKEDNVLLAQRHSEPRNNADRKTSEFEGVPCQNVEQLCGSVELVVFVD